MSAASPVPRRRGGGTWRRRLAWPWPWWSEGVDEVVVVGRQSSVVVAAAGGGGDVFHQAG